jgi:hypothetical protein
VIACIPTENRPKSGTHKLFEEAGIKAYHVLEPQEYDKSPLPNKRSTSNKTIKGLPMCGTAFLSGQKKTGINGLL